MMKDYVIEQYTFGKKELQLAAPSQTIIQNEYILKKQQDANTLFPFWAKVWPSAIALCNFLATETELIKNKKVIELAAGLGLPSIFASEYAQSVYCSDYSPDCMPFIKKSMELNGIANLSWGMVDWNHMPEDITVDVILMSDVNYDSTQFEVLYKEFLSFLQKNITIIMSTPQRLIGKPFIEKILPFCTIKKEMLINQMPISVFVLKQAHL